MTSDAPFTLEEDVLLLRAARATGLLPAPSLPPHVGRIHAVYARRAPRSKHSARSADALLRRLTDLREWYLTRGAHASASRGERDLRRHSLLAELFADRADVAASDADDASSTRSPQAMPPAKRTPGSDTDVEIAFAAPHHAHPLKRARTEPAGAADVRRSRDDDAVDGDSGEDHDTRAQPAGGGEKPSDRSDMEDEPAGNGPLRKAGGAGGSDAGGGQTGGALSEETADDDDNAATPRKPDSSAGSSSSSYATYGSGSQRQESPQPASPRGLVETLLAQNAQLLAALERKDRRWARVEMKRLQLEALDREQIEPRRLKVEMFRIQAEQQKHTENHRIERDRQDADSREREWIREVLGRLIERSEE